MKSRLTASLHLERLATVASQTALVASLSLSTTQAHANWSSDVKLARANLSVDDLKPYQGTMTEKAFKTILDKYAGQHGPEGKAYIEGFFDFDRQPGEVSIYPSMRDKETGNNREFVFKFGSDPVPTTAYDFTPSALPEKPLTGARIVLEPNTPRWATISYQAAQGDEPKQVHYPDAIFTIAELTKSLLEKQGATVYITRDRSNDRRPFADMIPIVNYIKPHATVSIMFNMHQPGPAAAGTESVRLPGLCADNYMTTSFNGCFMKSNWKGEAVTELDAVENRFRLVRDIVTGRLLKSMALATCVSTGVSRRAAVALKPWEPAPFDTHARGVVDSANNPVDGTVSRNLGYTKNVTCPAAYALGPCIDSETEFSRLASTVRSDEEKSNESLPVSETAATRLRDIATGYYEGIYRYFTGNFPND